MARLPVYLRALNSMSDAGTTTCSSLELATAAGVNSAKLRKDLSHLGSYGTRGVGYDVAYLRYQISREIGLTQDWPVVVVGIGNLGHALANYSGFSSRGFRTVALLDADESRHGEVVAGLEIRPFEDLKQVVADHGVGIGVIATPGHRRPGRRRPDGRGRHPQHPQLRADDPLGPRGRGRTPRRPVQRAADPRLPRAAQELRQRAGGPDRGRLVSVLVVGISHKTAPVSVLERVALDGERATKLLREVADLEHVTEATVLSTCNRTEIYTDVDRFHGSVESISRILGELAGQSPDDVLTHLYVHYDDAAVSHLFHVAAGLDSMVPGESQILGQTREALRIGQEQGSVGPALNVLFQQALRVGKRSHAETDIDRVAPSLVASALDRAAQHVGEIAGKHVVIVGAGSMASLTAATASRAGAASIIVANRTPERATRLAEQYAATAIPLAELAELHRPGRRARLAAPAPPASLIDVEADRLRAAATTAPRRGRPRPAARRRPGGGRTFPAYA